MNWDPLADVPEIDRDTLAAGAAILVEHTGKGDYITSEELSDRLGGLDTLDSTPKTRALIRRLTYEWGMSIAANSNGYYMMESEAELREYQAFLRKRALRTQQRIFAVAENFYEGQEGSLPPETRQSHLGAVEDDLADLDAVADAQSGLEPVEGDLPDMEP